MTPHRTQPRHSRNNNNNITREARSRRRIEEYNDVPQTEFAAQDSCFSEDSLSACPSHEEETYTTDSTLRSKPLDSDACMFDFFYRLIFSLVHVALSMILAPVMKHAKTQLPSGDNSIDMSLSSATDPELAGQEDESIASFDSCRRQTVPVAQPKSVSFTGNDRSRPPLGRIGVSSRSSSSLSSPSLTSSDSSVSSASSFSDDSRRSSRRISSRGRHPLDRIRLSPGASRTHHSTYFLSE